MCLKTRAEHPSWTSIRNRLANWVRLTTTLREAGGSQICIRQGVRPEAAAFEISRAAGQGLASTGAGSARKTPNMCQTKCEAYRTQFNKPFPVNILQELRDAQ